MYVKYSVLINKTHKQNTANKKNKADLRIYLHSSVFLHHGVSQSTVTKDLETFPTAVINRKHKGSKGIAFCSYVDVMHFYCISFILSRAV